MLSVKSILDVYLSQVTLTKWWGTLYLNLRTKTSKPKPSKTSSKQTSPDIVSQGNTEFCANQPHVHSWVTTRAAVSKLDEYFYSPHSKRIWDVILTVGVLVPQEEILHLRAISMVRQHTPGKGNLTSNGSKEKYSTWMSCQRVLTLGTVQFFTGLGCSSPSLKCFGDRG